MRNAYKILVRIPEEISLVERPRHKWKDDIKNRS
jgi:hypothetical protein